MADPESTHTDQGEHENTAQPAGYHQPYVGQAPTNYHQAPTGYGQAPAGYGPPQTTYGQVPGYDQPPPYHKEATLEEQSKRDDNLQAPPGYQGPPMAYPQPATVYTMPGYEGGTPVVVTSQPVTDRTILVRREPLVHPPPDYLVCSILVCIFCCWPLGIYAIVLSCGSRDSANLGDEAGAKAKGMRARSIIIAALLIGFIIRGIVAGLNIYLHNHNNNN